MKVNLFLALIIYVTSYILFILCFMHEFLKTKHKYQNKIRFLHALIRLQNNELKELRNKLKGDKNAEKEITES